MVRLGLSPGQSAAIEMDVRRFWWCLVCCSSGTALVAAFLVNLLALNGLFEMHEEVSEPAEMTQIAESK